MDLQPEDYKNLTSEQAAALYLTEGVTSNPQDAAVYHDATTASTEISQEDMIRSHLKRQMGFDFSVEFRPTKVTVEAKEGIKDSRWMRRPKEWTPKDIDKLVKTCLRVKKQWEKENV